MFIQLQGTEDHQQGSRRRPTSRRAVAAAFISGILMVVLPTVAFATNSAAGTETTFGPLTPAPHNYTYKDQNRVYTDSAAWAGIQVGAVQTVNVPAGYIGGKARLFKSSTLCKQSAVKYNSTPLNAINVYTAVPSCGVGSYKSDGWGYGWNGGGYTEHNATISPYLTLS